MPLPETNRIKFAKNPLAEVVAQLKFSPILRIDAEVPAKFQEAIRERFPLYRQVTPNAQLPSDVPPPIRNLIQGMGAAAGPISHLFESKDKRFSVFLSRDSMVYKVTNYSDWAIFREQVENLRNVLEQHYNPLDYERIGLRYVNIIHRSVLGLEGVPWSELLQPAVGGELTTDEFGEGIESASSQVHGKLDDDGGFITLRTGIAIANTGTMKEKVKERCFVIDCDFHTHGRTEKADVTKLLDRFNRAAGNLFRWAIQERLRTALQPTTLG